MQPEEGNEAAPRKRGRPPLSEEERAKRQKPKMSPEELSFFRSQIGRKGGSVSGYGTGGIPTHTLTVRQPDFDLLSGIAGRDRTSRALALHTVCADYLAAHPEMRPESWSKYDRLAESE